MTDSAESLPPPEIERRVGAPSPEAARGAGPKRVLLFLPVFFDRLFELLVPRMRELYGTRFFFAVNGSDRAAFARKLAAPGDDVIDVMAIEAAAEAAPLDVARELERARAIEQRVQVNYARDIIYSDRAYATYYFGFAPNTPLSRMRPPPPEEVVKRINYFFEWFEGFFKSNGIDLVIERPGGLCVSACVHAAMAAGIPSSFPRSSRIGAQVLWARGPFMDAEPFRAAYETEPECAPAPAGSVTPPDYMKQFVDADARWRSPKHLARRMALETLDQAIFLWRGLKAWRRPRRLGYFASRRYDVAKFQMHRRLHAMVAQDRRRLDERPFVLFLLQLEPEYSTLSLAREFNDTEACIKQLALSLPAGFNLAVKEHLSAVGNRGLDFYRRLTRLPNVILADHRVPGIALAQKAAAIATITGTIGVEAALLGKAAIVFGRHTEYSFLPHVEAVTDFAALPAQVARALRERTPAEIEAIRASGARYQQAMSRISFTREPGFFTGKGPAFSAEQIGRAAMLLADCWRGQIERPVALPAG